MATRQQGSAGIVAREERARGRRLGWVSCRAGFSLAELLVVLGIVGVLLSLAIPAAMHVRERSRAATCMNHLRQLALAAQAHASSHKGFPYTSTTWFDSRQRPWGRYHAVSPHRYLIAHVDAALFEKIDFEDPTDPVWGPAPPSYFVSPGNAQLQQIRIPVLACPSDDVPPGATSYRANLGISTEVLAPSATVEAMSQKGAFVNGRSVQPAEFLDGLSQTALLSERVVGDYSPSSYSPFQDFFATGDPVRGTGNYVRHCRDAASFTPALEFSFAGGSWLLGGWLNTWYSHVLPPNSPIPDCGLGPAMIDGGPMVVTARSFHPGGVCVAMADGCVRLVSNEVDLSVWRGAGTRKGRELPATP